MNRISQIVLSNPRLLQPVRLHYKNRAMPHHGKCGVVVIVGKGRPRNHGVQLEDGTRTVVPAGNLVPVKETP